AVYTGTGPYGNSTSSNLSQTINAKTLFVSGLSTSNKTYDGTTTATLSGTASLLTAEAFGSGTSSDGKPYSGDTVSLTSTAASPFRGPFASGMGGSGIRVSVPGNSLPGAAAGNYVLPSTNDQSGLTANITAKALTALGSLSGGGKVYDGTTTATPAG